MAVSTKGRRFPPEPLGREDVDRLMAECSRRAPSGIRNRALLALLGGTGLRISEALALQLKDVDFDATTVRVLHGKGDRARTVAIAPQALDALERWLDVRAELSIRRSAPLFCCIGRGREGEPLDSSYIRHLLPRLARKAGIEKRSHPHGIRHGFALRLARTEGVSLLMIQRQLGHARASTTDHYLHELAGPTELVELFRSEAEASPHHASPA